MERSSIFPVQESSREPSCPELPFPADLVGVQQPAMPLVAAGPVLLPGDQAAALLLPGDQDAALLLPGDQDAALLLAGMVQYLGHQPGPVTAVVVVVGF